MHAFQLAGRAKRVNALKLLKHAGRPYHGRRRRMQTAAEETAMSALQAMTIAIAISVCVSTILVAGLMTPLRALLRRLCPGPEGENFWARFTVLMLYLSPLLIALVF